MKVTTFLRVLLFTFLVYPVFGQSFLIKAEVTYVDYDNRFAMMGKVLQGSVKVGDHVDVITPSNDKFKATVHRIYNFSKSANVQAVTKNDQAKITLVIPAGKILSKDMGLTNPNTVKDYAHFSRLCAPLMPNAKEQPKAKLAKYVPGDRR